MRELPYIEKQGLRLTEKSFELCYVNPEAYAETFKLSTHPNLRDWIEFEHVPGKYETTEITNNMAIKYIVGMFDMGSPFRKLPYEIRKVCAAEYAGFKTNDAGIFPEKTQRFLNCEMPQVNSMIIRYALLSNGIKFSTFVRASIIYHEKTLMSDKVTAKTVTEDLNLLLALERELLSDENSKNLKNELWKKVTDEEKRIRDIRPEYMAEKYFAKYPQVVITSEAIRNEEV